MKLEPQGMENYGWIDTHSDLSKPFEPLPHDQAIQKSFETLNKNDLNTCKPYKIDKERFKKVIYQTNTNGETEIRTESPELEERIKTQGIKVKQRNQNGEVVEKILNGQNCKISPMTDDDRKKFKAIFQTALAQYIQSIQKQQEGATLEKDNKEKTKSNKEREFFDRALEERRFQNMAAIDGAAAKSKTTSPLGDKVQKSLDVMRKTMEKSSAFFLLQLGIDNKKMREKAKKFKSNFKDLEIENASRKNQIKNTSIQLGLQQETVEKSKDKWPGNSSSGKIMQKIQGLTNKILKTNDSESIGAK